MRKKITSILKKFGPYEGEESRTSFDVICGMEASSDLFKAEHKGKSYYFCSDHCREQFVANLDNYAD